MSDKKSCVICGSTAYKIIGRPEISEKARGFIRHDYRVVRCSNCGFYFINPEIDFTQAEWQTLYQDHYFSPMTAWWAGRRKRDRIGRLNRIHRLLGRKPERFLDVGCGEGYVLQEALNRGWEAYGCDIADNLLPAVAPKVKFFKGDLVQANFPNDFFDAVYLDSVLEHVPDPVAVLRGVKRVLKDGGLVYFAVPNEDSLYNDVKSGLYALSGKSGVSAQLKPFQTPFHIQGFTKGSIEELMARVGLKLSDFRCYAGEYEWLKYKTFTAPWIVEFFLIPVHLLGRWRGRAIYLEVIGRR